MELHDVDDGLLIEEVKEEQKRKKLPVPQKKARQKSPIETKDGSADAPKMVEEEQEREKEQEVVPLMEARPSKPSKPPAAAAYPGAE